MQFPGLPYPPLPVTGPLAAEPRRERVSHHGLSQNAPSETDVATWRAKHQRAMAPTFAALKAPLQAPLQSNGTVELINTYPHGLVHVPNRHISNGQQVLGKLYCMWFDASHRPYTFGGSLPRDKRNGGSADVATCWQERWAHCNTEDANEIAARREAVQQMTDLLRDNLKALKGQKFPTADLFLHTLHDRMLVQFNALGDSPFTEEELAEASLGIYENVLRDCYPELMHCNATDPAEDRELWPVVDLEHKQLRIDHQIALYVDNARRTHDPFSSHLLDHMPWFPNIKEKTVPGALTRKFMRRLRTKVEPVSHEAVRRAFNSLLLGANYFDERLQRSEAMCAAEVSAKNPDWRAAYAAHNEQVRARALAALAVPVAAKDPVLQAQLNAQRVAQARAILATPAFPVFANVPWRVQGPEVEQLRAAHVTVFKPLPKPGRQPMEGNCNSGVFFLLRQAALEQQKMEGSATPPVLDGGHGWRTFGATTVINIPHPDVLPEVPSST